MKQHSYGRKGISKQQKYLRIPYSFGMLFDSHILRLLKKLDHFDWAKLSDRSHFLVLKEIFKAEFLKIDFGR